METSSIFYVCFLAGWHVPLAAYGPLCGLVVTVDYWSHRSVNLSLQGGMYLLQLMDHYAASWSLLIIGLTEVLIITYVYGKTTFVNISRINMINKSTQFFALGLLFYFRQHLEKQFWCLERKYGQQENCVYCDLTDPNWPNFLLRSKKFLLPLRTKCCKIKFTSCSESLFYYL